MLAWLHNSWSKQKNSTSTPRYDLLHVASKPFQYPFSVVEMLESKRTLSRPSRFQKTGGEIIILGNTSSNSNMNHRLQHGPWLQLQALNRYYGRVTLMLMRASQIPPWFYTVHHTSNLPPPPTPTTRPKRWEELALKAKILPRAAPMRLRNKQELCPEPMGRMWLLSMRVLWVIIRRVVVARGCGGSSKGFSVDGDAYL